MGPIRSLQLLLGTLSPCIRMGGHEDNFVFLTSQPYMIYFWNPWDQGSTQEVFSSYFDTIRMIRKVKNDQKLGFWMIISILIGIVLIVTHNMYDKFWESLGPVETLKRFSRLLGNLKDNQEGLEHLHT